MSKKERAKRLKFIRSYSSINLYQQYYLYIDENHNEYILTQEEHLKQIDSKYHFSKEEKLKLFHSYFKGREDVYAIKWVNKEGKSGFSPHGEGQWVQEKNRGKTRFTKKYTSFYPYTLETVENHIKGSLPDFKFGIGIYPMVESDRTTLVVLDFDNKKADFEAKTVIELAKEYKINLLIERSQSGNGIHLWIFFKTPILASTARKLAHWILRAAMTRATITFSSFDRIIPMQDFISNKEFGNLIALPLRAYKVKEGKTVFLDYDLNPISNCWFHLKSIIKYTENEVKEFIEILEKDFEIGLNNCNKNGIYSQDQFIIINNGELEISKKSLPRKMLIKIAEFATFYNPDFYKRQNARMSTWNTPQFLTCAREDENNFYYPRALEEKILSHFPNAQLESRLSMGHKIEVSFKGKLREEQKEAIETINQHTNGIIKARTGFGKTVLCGKLITQKQVSTLIIVHRKELLFQWKRILNKFLEIKSIPKTEYTPKGRIKKKDKIGVFYSQKKKLSGNIDIALFQSLAQIDNLIDLSKDYGLVIVDEVHNAASKTYEGVLKSISSKYLYGLSATPERQDGLEKIIQLRIGEVIFQSSIISDEYIINKFYYPRFTSFKLASPFFDFQSYLNQLSVDESRNKQIVKDIKLCAAERRSILIITRRIEHILELENLISITEFRESLIVLHSELNKNILDQRLQIIMKLQKPIIVATDKLIGEGIDIPVLDTLFLVSPFSWKGHIQQIVGRLHRNLNNKNELRIYDYVDFLVYYSYEKFQKRVKEYHKLGYVEAHDKLTYHQKSNIFHDQTYLVHFENDLQSAAEAIVFQSNLAINYIKELSKKYPSMAIQVIDNDYKPHQFLKDIIILDKQIIWLGVIHKQGGPYLKLVDSELCQLIMNHFPN